MDGSTEVFTADYVGEPGRRAFYIQASDPAGVATFLVEKEQVSALAERLRDILVLLDADDTVRAAAPARDPAMALREPVEPRWRIGTMGLAYDEGADRIIVVMQPVASEGEEVSDDEGIRLELRREQVRAFVLHAVAVVSEGRPLCQLCGLPMEAEHDCPARNGHRVAD